MNKSKFFIFALLSIAIVLSAFSVAAFVSPAKVDLGTAGDFAILSEAGITNVQGSTTHIIGDMGVSPITYASITGFDLIGVPANDVFLTSASVTGKIYAADLFPPTPINMGTAISDMHTAYTAATSPAPDATELYSGDISGRTLTPGVYKWSSGLLIGSTGVTLSGSANDVFIFQIAQDLTVANGAIVTLSGGVLPQNIFWQVAGQVTLGTTVQFKGIILSKTLISMNTGAILNGRALAQTAVTLDANAVTAPTTVPRTPINLHVNDYVNTHVTISQPETKVEFSLVNPVGQSSDNVVIPFTVSGGKLVLTDSNMPPFLNEMLSSYTFPMPDGTTGTISFKISDIINGINFTANVADGATFPTFSSVSVSGTIPLSITGLPGIHNLNDLITLINLVTPNSLTLADLNNPAFLTTLAQSNPSPTPMVGTASLVKLGNDITIIYNRGFTYAQQNYPSTDAFIEDLLVSTVPNSGTGNLQSFVDTASLLHFIPSTYQDLANLDYTVSTDLTLIDNNLQDGTYPVPVILTSSYGDEITDNIELTLIGLHATPYVPSTDNQASNWISKVSNLPFGSKDVSVAPLLPSQVPSAGTNINFLKAMTITVDQTTTTTKGGDIHFSVDKSSVSNRNKVILYVLEGSVWTPLTMDYSLSDSATEYTYSAHTPHFSTFMIGEDITPASSGDGGGETSAGGGTRTVGTTSTTQSTTTPTGGITPTSNPTPANPAPLTGGVVGFLTSTGGIVVLVFLVGITATLVGVSIVKKRRVSA
ncbi:MAG: ice-binding family protein [Nanoarchaeota archaeon]|nr:ice-binding family protein [Nanoarchaeota archaeon]